MLQVPDYTILDNLAEPCEIIDFNFRYLYANEAAIKQKSLLIGEIHGHKVSDIHPNIDDTPFLSLLKKCMDHRIPVEFDDGVTKQKIRMDPVPEGVFVHSVSLHVHGAKIRARRITTIKAAANTHSTDSLKVYEKLARGHAGDLEIEGWLDALDVRTKETSEHILRVTAATVTLAHRAGVPESEIPQIRHGALLHDIGKIGISDSILLKSDRLTTDEWDVVRKHPDYAYDLLYSVEYLQDRLPIPYSHHEKWDGTGYPQGLRGDEIPLAARLFSIVDVWDSLSFESVYHEAWSQPDVVGYIQDHAGSHFDPHVVDLFTHAYPDLKHLCALHAE